MSLSITKRTYTAMYNKIYLYCIPVFHPKRFTTICYKHIPYISKQNCLVRDVILHTRRTMRFHSVVMLLQRIVGL